MAELVHGLGEAYLERNHFLEVVLGMLSSSRGLRRALLVEDLEAPEPQGSLDELALGIISFSLNLERHIEKMAAEPQPKTRPKPERPLGDLLL